MKATKKIAALMLALVLALSMTACGSSDKTESKDTAEAGTTAAAAVIQQQIPAANPVRNSRSVSASWFSMKLLMQQLRASLMK